MEPDKFRPSLKLVGIWRAGLVEAARISKGVTASHVVSEVPSHELEEDISSLTYGMFASEFQFERCRHPKVLPLFGDGGLWPSIAKHLDHSLHMCDEGVSKFLKQLEIELYSFFKSGKIWESSWGRIFVEDGTVYVRLIANVPVHYEPATKKTIDIDL